MKIVLIVSSLALLLYSIFLTTLVFNTVLEIKRSIQYLEFQIEPIVNGDNR